MPVPIPYNYASRIGDWSLKNIEAPSFRVSDLIKMTDSEFESVLAKLNLGAREQVWIYKFRMEQATKEHGDKFVLPTRFHVADVNMRGLQQWKSIDEAFVNLAKEMTKVLDEAGFPQIAISYANIRSVHHNPDGEIGTWSIAIQASEG